MIKIKYVGVSAVQLYFLYVFKIKYVDVSTVQLYFIHICI